MKATFGLGYYTLTLLVSLWCGIAVAANKDPKAVKSADLAPSSSEYLIGADDILLVNVWKEAEISRTVLVRPDGKISLPLLGDLPASGRTTIQLRDDIAVGLRSYLADPEVTVIVQEARSQRFNILGEVEHPGSYPLSRSMTVLDAIAAAGGFREFAKAGKIFVLRVQPDGSRTRIPFNYKDAIKAKNHDQTVRLQPQDTVVVP